MINRSAKFLPVIIFSFLVIRETFPFNIPLFPFFIVVSILLTCFQDKKLVFFTKNLLIIYLLEIIYIFYTLLYSNYNSVIVNDIKNIISLNLIIIIFFSNLRNNFDFENFIKQTSYVLFIYGLIIGIVSILKFYLLTNDFKINFFYYKDIYPWGSTLIIDYNLYSLSLIIIILFTYRVFINTDKLIIKHISIISICLSIFCILFSGSRRGLLIVVLILLSYFLIMIYNRKTFLIKNKKYLFTSILTFLLIFILFNTKFYIDDSEIKKITNISEIKRITNISETINSYSFIEARIIRWKYSIELYIDYSFDKKLIGDGFSYIKNFGDKLNTIDYYDYPHNILLSHLLYSGVLGLSILLILFFIIIKVYLNYRYLNIFFIIFSITTLYTMISFNSLFSSMLYLSLLIIPLLYDKIEINNKGKK